MEKGEIAKKRTEGVGGGKRKCEYEADQKNSQTFKKLSTYVMGHLYFQETERLLKVE